MYGSIIHQVAQQNQWNKCRSLFECQVPQFLQNCVKKNEHVLNIPLGSYVPNNPSSLVMATAYSFIVFVGIFLYNYSVSSMSGVHAAILLH